ncbi:EscU/YscU/HrcU family type III secretion system export apparatus switch protein [Bacillus sp. EB600]|uniref:EscU/YscU/HrcU family type III secretion system export apparatus switch protein n=1 Tax=Bacillus sp. EB600 TaxID=2806345 RepID=UPI00210A5CA4|nr:EscU/YscU/HrcU family type III secretion system export apparatus switch protein [Bacillus sp. EB600]MCQ6279679.1 EscU/YscU/HrcU family type III secretion system export apparatus switch protein [Bacillus sp. EB600]
MKKEDTNFRKEAVALTYHPDSADAPIVAAKGKGKTAEMIIEKAKENQIPVQEDPALVNLLGQLNVNDRIPQELYQAVAEVFAFIYKLDKNIEKGKT